MKSSKVIMSLIVIILIVIYSCTKSNSSDPVYNCLNELVKLENEIKSDLDEVNTDTGFTLKCKLRLTILAKSKACRWYALECKRISGISESVSSRLEAWVSTGCN
ncbi:hypothetical protein MNBD_BACTEROID01-2209 [hydrothermal vent metagenome]|uniref:Lipoprotein n=1 Tax=hydrothermal vent metagenome TaxID=652676 RepID=A0A3B0U050_9ZZZZ